MNQSIYRYNFHGNIPITEAEESLMLAVLAAEGIFGRSRVRLEASFLLDKAKRSCVIDATAEVGSHISRIFNSFLARQFGEAAFTVKQADRSSITGGMTPEAKQ